MNNTVLKSAMLEAQKRELSILPKEDELINIHSFSPGFQEKVEKMIRIVEKNIYIY